MATRLSTACNVHNTTHVTLTLTVASTGVRSSHITISWSQRQS